VHLLLKKLVLIYSDVYKSVLLLIFETKKVNFAASKVKNVSRYMYVKQLQRFYFYTIKILRKVEDLLNTCFFKVSMS